MLEVTNLTKNYGATEVLRGIGFHAEHGQVLGILGPNGAGKSTTMNIIAGFIPKSGGSVRVCGIDTNDGDTFKKHIGYLPESTPLHVNMTVDEFLEFVSDLKNVPKRGVKSGIAKAADLTGLSHVRRRLIRNLSKGYKQRVGIAQALIGFPEVLILDEPTGGLDPTQLIEIRRLVRELGREHTVIFSSHILVEAESVCDRVVVLCKGRVLADGKPSELIAEQSGAFRLSAAVTPEQVADALAAAGIKDAVIEPLNRSLEDEFVRLIARAEQGDAQE
jgi:ABC-2 type transport system ATP-binding protein